MEKEEMRERESESNRERERETTKYNKSIEYANSKNEIDGGEVNVVPMISSESPWWFPSFSLVKVCKHIRDRKVNGISLHKYISFQKFIISICTK